jgi:hypothetical protein
MTCLSLSLVCSLARSLPLSFCVSFLTLKQLLQPSARAINRFNFLQFHPMLGFQRILFTIVISSALVSAGRSLHVTSISSSSDDICDCPQPDACDKHSCPAGCFSRSSKHCIPAAAGFYAQLTNKSASNIESACESGSFTSVPASTACTACPAGQYAENSASTSCNSCPAGTQCPYAGMCSPFPCTAGTYSSTVGAICTQQPFVYVYDLSCCSCPLFRLHHLPPRFLLPSHGNGKAYCV